MTAGDTVKCQACFRSICLAYTDTGGVFRGCVSFRDGNRKLVGKRSQGGDKLLQFCRYRAVIQAESQKERFFHPGKYRIQLLDHLVGEKFPGSCCFRINRDGCFTLLWCRHISTHTGLTMACCHIFFQLRCCQRTVTGGGHHLTQGLNAHISRGVYAVCTGFLGGIGYDIALLIQFYNTLDRIRGRGVSGKNEHAEGIIAFVFRHHTGGGVFIPGIG